MGTPRVDKGVVGAFQMTATLPAPPTLALHLDPLKVEKSLVTQSFYDFFLRFWPVVSGEKLVLNWHIKVLCDELQAIAMRVFGTVDPVSHKRIRQPKLHDLVINIPPGTTKSTICSVMFPVWCWLHDPTCRLICGSYTESLALYLANQSHGVVNSEKFRTLFPDVILVKNTGHEMRTSCGGWRIACGTGADIIGKHSHIQIIDDPISAMSALSEAELRTSNRWMDLTLPMRFVDKSVGVQILIMQRLGQNDPTANKLEKSPTCRHICLPAMLTEKVRPRSLRKYYVGGLLDPVRLPRALLTSLETGDLGPFGFAGQMMQDPIAAGMSAFDVGKIEVSNAAPGMVSQVRYWDKAYSGGKGCYTVGVLMGKDRNGFFWILDVVRGQWEASRREAIIKQTAQRDGRKVLIGVEQEPAAGKESAQATLRNLAGWWVRLDRPLVNKVARADPVSVQVNGGNFKMLKGDWNGAYLNELQFFPYGKYADQVDATSGSFAMLTGRRYRVGATLR